MTEGKDKEYQPFPQRCFLGDMYYVYVICEIIFYHQLKKKKTLVFSKL